jgi:hypothetical protein
MSIQPGVGYTFSSSSLGTNFNIEKPWSEWDPSGARIIQQFQVGVKRVDDVNKLQLAKGTVSFTQSNMPRIKLGAHSDQRQSWISKVAVYGTGITRTAGTDEGSSVWMEDGGYYNINSAGTYYITISKFDINQSNDDTESKLLNAEQPWVSIFKASDSIESTIFSETGPSEYVNKTNMQKMKGYDATSTGLDGDWGNCHTTWFNPVKWGYSVKLIAIVTATTDPFTGMKFVIDQHIVGPIDIQIPVQFIGTTLCNQSDLNEENDPYNENKDSDPKWSFFVNADTLTNLEGLTAANEDWFQEFVGPADWTSINYKGLITGSCAKQDDDACLHPFQFHPFVVKSEAGDLFRADVCAGTANNLIPFDEPASGQLLPATIDFLNNEDTYIYLRMGTKDYDTDNPIFPVTTQSDPYYPTIVQSQTPLSDDNEYCYILMGLARFIGDPEKFTIDQTISGSVWAERLKIGERTAQYYWAGV